MRLAPEVTTEEHTRTGLMSPRALHLASFDAHLERFRESSEIHDGLPEVETHEDVLYTPARNAPSSGYLGALFDRRGERIAAGNLVRYRATFNKGSPEPERQYVAGTGLYLGWLLPIYGHALLEGLARAWAPKKCDFTVYHSPKVNQVPPYLQAHLDRLGLPSVLIPSEPTRFERLIVPKPALELADRAYTGFLDVFPRGPQTDPRPVYVSRSRLVVDARAVAGEKVLERALAAAGYTIIYPETLSTPQQLDVFSRHSRYVGMIGSAMHNTLFNRAPEMTYLTEGLPNPTFLLCDELLNADSLYVGCCDRGDMPDLARQMPLRLDLARAADALRVSVDTTLQPAVDQRHREMWAEVRLKQGIMRRDSTALRDLRHHYGRRLTPRLLSLARSYASGSSRRGLGRRGLLRVFRSA